MTDTEFQFSYEITDDNGNNFSIDMPASDELSIREHIAKADQGTLTCADGKELTLDQDNLRLQLGGVVFANVGHKQHPLDDVTTVKETLMLAKVSDLSDALTVDEQVNVIRSQDNIMEKTCSGEFPIK